uniref:Uncharacterized protein n=1 Tax=Caenorhabditis japonica TaxID=281687 RepID=A0A8R1DQF0_CAEJA
MPSDHSSKPIACTLASPHLIAAMYPHTQNRQHTNLKVGDNSAVNLLPILADELSETKNLSRLDPTGDINLNKILPSKTPLDPDKIDFLWKQLPPHYVTMFNDDVMHTTRGLFHYPPDNFLGGFTKAPAQFYYRPYYNHLYSQLSNWWRVCLDGDFLAGTFIDSWFRFERTFAKVPHFGFTFISRNFDLHATLKFLINLTNNRTQPATRGTNLFEVQNAQKSCQDNGVISNHCLCMIDATQDLYSKEAPNPEILAKTLRDYFVNLNFSDHCLLLNTMKCGNVTETLMPNNYVQVWARTKISDSEVRRKKTKPSPVVYPYLTCHVENTFGEQVEILAQFRLVQATEAVSIVYEPRIRALAGKCAYFSFAKDYCDCIVY